MPKKSKPGSMFAALKAMERDDEWCILSEIENVVEILDRQNKATPPTLPGPPGAAKRSARGKAPRRHRQS